ncbi:MAG TPA: hypothetical protein VH207_09385 [Chthoniobacterales bacterium]|jgi:hypothetical protein|nr:hypothetical protein [Chthoniobacterales bacterium]
MPRNLRESDRFLTLDHNLRVVAAPPRRNQAKRVPRRLDEPRPFVKRPGEEPCLPLPSLLRHRTLLLAALRVWELRNGIHGSW